MRLDCSTKAIAIMTALNRNPAGVTGEENSAPANRFELEMRNRTNAAAINEHNNEFIDF
jgi:hypothetical protein